MKTQSKFRLLCAASAFAAGCGGEEFPVAQVQGRVVCEAQPVADVFVFFEPTTEGASALVGKAGMALTAPDGTFTISTFGADDGAVIGKHRVRVAPREPGAECACELNENVDVTNVDVTGDGPNEFEILLKKRRGPAPKVEVEPEE